MIIAKIKSADTHFEWHQEYIRCWLNISWYSPLNSAFSLSLFGTTKGVEGADELLLSPEKDPLTGRKDTKGHPQATLDKQT